VKRLLEDSRSLEIEVSPENFNPKTISDDLERFETWKTNAETILKRLESELNRKSELALEGELKDKFYALSKEVSQCPVYCYDIFVKIQAYDWVYTVCKLLNSQY